jgi:hypothetical protein
MLPGDIDSGVASQVGLVFALEIVVARIDVPSFSFLFRLNVALFAAMGLGVALVFHFWIPPFFLGRRFDSGRIDCPKRWACISFGARGDGRFFWGRTKPLVDCSGNEICSMRPYPSSADLG